MLSIGIASTGVLTLAYFAIAGHLLKGRTGPAQYSHLDVLWSVMFVIISVIYRPIEQLLSRTIADHEARGIATLPMRVPITIQGSFALLFLAVALPLHDELAHHVFYSDTLYWIFVVGIVAYAASYFARGWLAGHKLLRALRRPRLHGVDLADRLRARRGGRDHPRPVGDRRSASPPRRSSRWSSCRRRSRAGARSAATPPPATDAALEGPAAEGIEEAVSDLSIRRGWRLRDLRLGDPAGRADAAQRRRADGRGDRERPHAGSLPGIVFNVLLITRAPLQLFQAIQTSLLPHLAGLEVDAGPRGLRARDPPDRAGDRRVRRR